MPLELQLLGATRVLRDGDEVPLPPSKKARALLAYLVVNRRIHRRQQLSDLLWDVADDPRGGLRWCLSKLRPLLTDGDRTRIVADRETVTADIDGLHVDALAWLDADIEGASRDELERLCGRVEGDFCEGLELEDFYGFHAWCLGQRLDLRRRHAQARARLVDLTDDPAAALAHARTLCALRPGEPDPHVDVVRILRALGHDDEAEAHRKAARQRLAAVGPELAARFDGAIKTMRVSAAPTPDPSVEEHGPEPPRQAIRYCRSADGTGIALAEVGEGPTTLVKCANWISNLEHDFRSPVWRHMFRALSTDRRLIRYDQRGNGLSDRRVEDLSFERQLEDLEAVMDAAQCERVPLLGISQGGPIAVEYAARHPERVSHLILYGAYAKGWKYDVEERRQAAEALVVMTRMGWGMSNPAFRQLFTTLFVPEADQATQEWFNEVQRLSSSGDTAARVLEAVGAFDVRERMAQVRCPTLVMHLDKDHVVAFDNGKELAAGIPGARFVPIEGQNHLPLETDAAFRRVVDEIDRFLDPSRSN